MIGPDNLPPVPPPRPVDEPAPAAPGTSDPPAPHTIPGSGVRDPQPAEGR